jgi:YbbR domain-containing protein
MSKASFSARAQEIGKQLLKAGKHVLFHNGWVKLLAVLISLTLWAGLISQDNTLTRDKTWQNVNISINGADTMKRNGFIVTSNLEELLSNVTVSAAVPQKQYDAADTSAYNLRVDLTRINSTGEQELRILSTSSATYGKVISTTPSAVNVTVEEYFVRQRIPVQVDVTGDYKNGWYGDWYMPSPSVDPVLIAVNGPRDIVNTISRAKATLNPENIEWAEGTMQTTGEIRLYNRSGEEVISPLINITTESVQIDTVLMECSILPVRSFSIPELIETQGKVKDGYRIASVKVSPETIRVAARNDVLEQMDDLALDRNINLQDLSETTVFQLKVQKPSEDAVLSNETVTVTVEVEPDE